MKIYYKIPMAAKHLGI